MPVRQSSLSRIAKQSGKWRLWCSFVLGISLVAVGAEVVAAPKAALADLSLEELADLEVISISKSAKPVATAAASIYVLTQRQIDRSAATSLPEALRLAPNLQVARTNARNYAISSRGFNNALVNKLLVLIDGRSVYSPLFSGVFWDSQDVILEDLDRIEAVSGPGGTLWGANAVNGVVNIVSRSAAQTQGELVSLSAGNLQQQVAARYGGELSENGHYRVYAKHQRHDAGESAEGASLEDDWQRSLAGFRTDWGDGTDSLTVQGNAYSGALAQAERDDIEIGGAHVLVRASREYSPNSDISVQAYIDYTQREQPQQLHQDLTTFDVELQHEWSAAQRHDLVWGGGVRYMVDRIDNLGGFAFLPADKDMHWLNIFLQDEIKLFDNIRLTLGGKFERNPFTGWEALPSAKLAWVPAPHQLLWGSLSHVVRSPSRIDRDFFAPANPEVIDGVPQYSFTGGANFESEVADVLQLGYRAEHWAKVSYSLTGFYSRYDKLRTIEPLSDNRQGIANGAEANTYGVEMWAGWQATQLWRLHGGLVVQRADFDLKAGSQDLSNTTSVAVQDPDYYWQLRSSYDVSERVSFDASLRHVDNLAGSGVPSYRELDASITWRVLPRLELSLLGHNLLGGGHTEFVTAGRRSVQERALYGKLVWGL